MATVVVCSNPAEDCPNCPRWMDDCEGLDEYNELLENVDCGWK